MESLKTTDPVANTQLLDFQESLSLDAGLDREIAAALGVDWEQLLQYMVDCHTDGADAPADIVWDAAHSAGAATVDSADVEWHATGRGGEGSVRNGIRLAVADNLRGAFWLAALEVGGADRLHILDYGVEASQDAAKSRAENFADTLSATLPAAIPSV